ncbi:hypothetical protein [Nocardioides currus]|uniref:Uncharacterized protein n=1 Tax=Nocardioides currus TaxID=2133958 RepID=A0A2R7YWM2_9ACTN|nr:hypothetical protein [Nocardioides currus]PUA80768.1 hypothetical protein C7S10_13570 [Nocardioides currus]
MRTLTRRLGPHARTSWLALVGFVALLVVVSTVAVLLNGGGRPAVVGTVFTGVVVFGVLAAFLDAILVPGNPDVRRETGRAAGWSGTLGAGWSDGGGHGAGGDGGGSCP